MIIYDEYGSKSYFVFDELTDNEKQKILEEDFRKEIEEETIRRCYCENYAA